MMTQEATTNAKIRALEKVQGALLSAAVGDALGWAQEIPAKHINKKQKQTSPKFEFQEWDRKAGGQYYPYVETILAGEYSDDSQLLLCTARSLLKGKEWWNHLTQKELPTWITYERGGGASTLKAVRAWLRGEHPWSSDKTRKEYFEAGGNGVAMRILPHCIEGVFDSNFDNVRRNIVADGITTHGHPRALLGALAYGFALWLALRETGVLRYGDLIDKLLVKPSVWSELPDIDLYCPDWKKAAKEVSNNDYEKEWQTVVAEMLRLLEKAKSGIEQAALAIDEEYLKDFGCFGKYKGSGTITAAAAIFLASRYAADSAHGIVEAAFAHGTDTDTLASMTGALLGAISGFEWLERCANQVQDSHYFRTIGERLLQRSAVDHNGSTEASDTSLGKSQTVVETLEKMEVGSKIRLTDTREATVLQIHEHQSLSKSTRAKSWKLFLEDGQTVYVKKAWHEKSELSAEPHPAKDIAVIKHKERPKKKDATQLVFTEASSEPLGQSTQEINLSAELLPVKVADIAIRLPVRDLAIARFFYEKVLGLECSKETKNSVRIGNIFLSQIAKDGIDGTEPQSMQAQSSTPDVYVEVASLQDIYENVRRANVHIVKPLSETPERKFFTCLDPSDHLVQIIEKVEF